MPTLTLQPAAGKDAGIDDLNPTTNRGTATTNIVGQGSGGDIQRLLIQFDISSIPSTAQISSAILDLHLDNLNDGAGAQTHNVHRVTRAWTEGDNSAGSGVTWNTYNGTNNWSSAGGDYDATEDASTVVTVVAHYTWDIKALVQEWVDGTTNRGLILKDSDEDVGSRKRYVTSDSTTAASRPKLTINYNLGGSFLYNMI